MRRSLPLRFSIPLLLVLLATIITFIQAAHEWVEERQQLEEQALRQAESVSQILVPTLEQALLKGETYAPEDDLVRLSLVPNLSLALVCDDANRILYATDFRFRGRLLTETPAAPALPLLGRARLQDVAQAEVTPDGRWARSAFPFHLAPQPGELHPARIAVLFVQMDLLPGRERVLVEIFRRSSIIGAGTLLACLLVWAYLRGTFTQHLDRLVRHVAAYSSGKGELRVPADGDDELSQVGRVMNQLFADISAKHEALRASEERFRRLFDGAADPVFVHDTEGRVVDVNRPACEGLGYSREELLRLSVSDVEAGLPTSELAPAWDRVRRGEIATLEGVHRRRDGSTFPVEVRIAPLAFGDRPLFFAAARDIRSRKEAEAALRESEQRWRAVVEAEPECVKLIDAEGKLVEMNPAGLAMIQGTLDVVRGKRVSGLVVQEDRPAFDEMVAAVFRGETRSLVFDMVGLEGRRLTLDTTSVPLWDPVDKDRVKFLLGVTRDITRQRKLEEQFRHAQRMEAIGQLAGGVAHDFNNILAAIMLQLSLLRQNPRIDERTLAGLSELEGEAQRAANLTRQLLMFSRRSVLEVRILDLNDVVANLLKMLGRLLGEHIRLVFEPAHGLPFVEADAGMIEQALMNLAVNARDAMPGGGCIRIATEAVAIDADLAAANPSRRVGRFVRLTVSDTGCGMDAATLSRIFEPFFTTKELGKGTGLGLATVHGIVAQHQGWVEVESLVGQGSSFHVYLPASEKATIQIGHAELPAGSTGKETLLVVEDEAGVRRAMVQTLRLLGYRVLEAGNGVEALKVWESVDGRIDLLLTDMVMPEGMTGLDLAKALRERRPALKIIVSSGYSAEVTSTEGIGAAGVTYLTKPYPALQLGETVRKVLDGEGPG